MHQIIGSLIVGAFVGEGARKLSWRPLLRGAIRQGILAQRYVAGLTATVRAETSHLVAEAREELDRSHRGPDSAA